MKTALTEIENSDLQPNLFDPFEESQKWLFNQALPFWAAEGPDRKHGGFREELTFGGKDANIPFKRTRVTCRQIYVFSHANAVGWDEGRSLIGTGVEYLIDCAWNKTELGFVRRLTQAGEVLDPTIDLYDNAFALFALTWAYRATGDAIYRDWARRTLSFIRRKMKHPNHAGYLNSLGSEGFRLQNPHMHLLEASLSGLEATGEHEYRELAVELLDLFRKRLYVSRSGTLGEYFSDDWQLAPEPDGTIVEPGHQLEWAWILYKCEVLLGIDTKQYILALFNSSERFGLNRQIGMVMNKVTDKGTRLDAGSRTWPNTERIKAAVALVACGLQKEFADRVLQQAAQCVLTSFLGSGDSEKIFPDGCWIDAYDARGKATSMTIPASTLYHVILAFMELRNLGNMLRPSLGKVGIGSATSNAQISALD